MFTLKPETRKTRLIEIARTQGRVMVDGAAVTLGVTPQTIRRDLSDLCEAGKLTRIHGGAVPVSSVRNIDHEARRKTASDAKDRIAQAALRDIPDHSVVFLGIGTTAEAVARALLVRRGLMILTNNLHAAQILTAHDDARVLVSGGVLRMADSGLVGPETVRQVTDFRADVAVIGVSAIESDGGLMDYDPEEVAVSRAALASARLSMLVADREKLARTAPLRVAPIEAVDVFCTDRPLPAELNNRCVHGATRVSLAMPG